MPSIAPYSIIEVQATSKGNRGSLMRTMHDTFSKPGSRLTHVIQLPFIKNKFTFLKKGNHHNLMVPSLLLITGIRKFAL